MQEEIVDASRDKNFEMIGVDLWNGTPTQLNAFKFVTQVKFPLLQLGTNESIPWGLGVENIIIIDPEGITRGIISIEDREKVVELIDLINNPAPVSELKPKSLYYGLTSEVGVARTITVTVENTGLKDLVVSSIAPSTDQVMVDRTSFTVLPGETEQFVATLLPTMEGDLTGNVKVITNEKTWTLDISQILIEGGLPPSIVLPETSVDYGIVELGRSQSQTIQIRNDGLGPLTVSSLECDLPGISFSESAFTVGPGETKTVGVTVQPSGEGPFAGLVTVTSDDPDKASLTVSIAGTAQVILADPRTDFDGSGTVDFTDFLSFAGAFGTTDATFDVNADGSVGFNDFLIFVENFGRSVQ